MMPRHSRLPVAMRSAFRPLTAPLCRLRRARRLPGLSLRPGRLGLGGALLLRLLPGVLVQRPLLLEQGRFALPALMLVGLLLLTQHFLLPVRLFRRGPLLLEQGRPALPALLLVLALQL